MSVRLDKPWRAIDAESVDALPGQLGVFELGDADDRVLLIGCADARTRFGLRSAVAEAIAACAEARQFRIEITSAYRTRYLELLMAHRADHGHLPPHNGQSTALGRLSPG